MIILAEHTVQQTLGKTIKNLKPFRQLRAADFEYELRFSVLF